MGVQYLKLRGMIDSALGHPEKGIVNLNMLHSLLHEILNHLDKETTAAETPGLIKNEVKNLQDAQPVFSSQRKVLSSEILSETDAQLPHVIFGEIKSLENVPSHGNEQSTFNEFEHRLESLESKLDALNNLLTDKSFLAPSTQSDNAQSNKENALAIMWKYMTINKRVQATEEGVEKVINILNDLIGDVEELKGIKSHLDKLHQEQLKIAEDFDAVKKGNGLEINSEKFNFSSEVALKKDLATFVTWSALEQALNQKENKGFDIDKTDAADASGEADCVSDERPCSVPFPATGHKVSVDGEPPRSAITSEEYTKLGGQNPVELNSFAKNDDAKDLLSSKENSLGEISLDNDFNSNLLLAEDTKASIVQPSPQFLNQLNRIGELPKHYDDVAVQVSMMSAQQCKLASDVQKVEVDILPRKVDKEDMQLPENFAGQIEMLKQRLDTLDTNQDLQMLATIKNTSVENKENIERFKGELGMFSQHLKRLDQLKGVKETDDNNIASYDLEVLKSVREKLNTLEQEQEKIVLKSKEDVDKILENLDEKQKIIDDLFEYTERLQERKADRENVATEMDIKADKHALEGKVNQSTFDETFQMFDRGLQEALQKMEDYMNEEMSLKDTLSRISHDMEGKIDNDSLQLMKDYFEKQIKDVQESRDKIARETRMERTDAAGVRRKLPIHYHCISCNRPVELPIRDSEPALPESESLPYRRMKIPFASYEVEQLRQRSTKSGYNDEESAAIRDLVSNRPCGGSHTVINSQIRKSTRFHQFNQAMAVSRFVPKVVREVSVLDFLRGSDGHYYKGRSRQLLPAIPHHTKYPSHNDVTVDSGSYKDNGSLLHDEASQRVDQQKGGSHYLQRSPSPLGHDNLSSSYPDRPKAPHAQTQRYSSDDLNIPNNGAMNRESLKIFRRKRGQDKESKRPRCWDSRARSAKSGASQEDGRDSNPSSSPKSMKRSTPVGEEQPDMTPSEESPEKHDVQKDVKRDSTRISRSNNE